MRNEFIAVLNEAAAKDNRIWLLTGDLGYSVLEAFAERFPGRFVNAGVAEQNMTGVAAGLALSGKIVFTYSIANFPTIRCLEQIRNDICYHNLNVKIVAVGGGLTYGLHGYTHHGVEDLAVMQALPNMTVLAPGDRIETRLATEALINRPGPCYLRLGKTGQKNIYDTPPDFQIGKGLLVRNGRDLTLIGTGSLLENVAETAELLAEQGLDARVLSMPTIKPIDFDIILKAARETHRIITVEEHSLVGGLGSSVAKVMAENQAPASLHCCGISEALSTRTGSREALLDLHGLTPPKLAALALKQVKT